MKKFGIGLIGVMMMLLFWSPIAAAEYQPEVLAQLLAHKYKIVALNDLEKAGIITTVQAKAGIEAFLADARKASGTEIPLGELLLLEAPAAQTVELTFLQKIAGKVTLINFFWVLAIGVGTLCVGYIIWWLMPILRRLFHFLPVTFYEALLYFVCVDLMVAGYWLERGVGEYVSLTGCVLFAGALILSKHLHGFKSDERRFFGTLTIVYAIVAIAINTPVVGFIAVFALFGFLGFSGMVIPCGYVIGFKDKESLGAATTAAFLILIGFIVLRFGGHMIPALKVFEAGALFIGSFVGYLGILIASSRYYDDEGYVFRQVVALVTGIGAIVVGSLLGVGELLKIGGTFFVLWLIEKPFDIPDLSKIKFACLGLAVSAAIYGGCLYVRMHPALAEKYLLYAF